MTQGRSNSASRLTLLATVGAIGAAVLLAGPGGYWRSGMGVPASAAESMLQHPAGFADIVAKVKPAVISVRVKVPASAEPSLFEQNRNDEEEDQIPAPSGSRIRPGPTRTRRPAPP